MKVSGTATLSAPPERVWEALNDPAVLVRTIPGCQRLEAVGQDSYRMTVAAGVASIKGLYQGDVSISDAGAARPIRAHRRRLGRAGHRQRAGARQPCRRRRRARRSRMTPMRSSAG